MWQVCEEMERETALDNTLLLPFQISQLNVALSAQARAILSRHGDLTLPQWRIIWLVSSGVASTSTSVRKTANIDKGQFSKTLNVLVGKGLVELAPYTQDKRQFSISLTEKGWATHALLAPEMEARQLHLLDALTDQERELFYQAIQALSEAAKRHEFFADRGEE